MAACKASGGEAVLPGNSREIGESINVIQLFNNLSYRDAPSTKCQIRKPEFLISPQKHFTK